jgi:glutamate synthase domain-containing protein 1
MHFEKDISGCGLSGFIDKSKKRVSGEEIIKSIALQHDRGNGLGGGFAAYGIYPAFKNHYAFHIMYDNMNALNRTEEYLHKELLIDHYEKIPIRRTTKIMEHPILRRYFVKPKPSIEDYELLYMESIDDDDFIVRLVMHINANIRGAYVFSSGKNMGAFKGVGFPEDIAEFFRLDEYKGYIWTAHNRFPTNTPGWWGGAHPFTLLDWSIVHNGEISSYGINKRYLEMFGYKCSLFTDTEVITYALDLLIRKHKLPKEVVCKVLSSAFWKDVDTMDDIDRELNTALRMVYGSALLNGPFSILFAYKNGMIGLNDRVKLRPLIVGYKGNRVYMASEESAIRIIEPKLDSVFAPKAGEPVIVEFNSK